MCIFVSETVDTLFVFVSVENLGSDDNGEGKEKVNLKFVIRECIRIGLDST